MSVYKLIIQILGQDKGASRELREVKREVTGLEAATGKLSGAMGALGVMGLAYMGKQAVGAAWDLGKLGAESMRLETAFVELAKQAGGTSDAIRDAIKRAAAGTVSNIDIMAAANKGLLLGLGASAKQWEELTKVAMFRGRAMGLTVTQALSDITTGIGRESRMILDNLGIVLDMDKTLQDYSQTIGKTVGQLDAMERKQAILQSVLSAGNAQIEAAGGITEDAAASFERLDAAVSNLKQALGVTFAPMIAGAAEGMAGFLNAISGNLPVIEETERRIRELGQELAYLEQWEDAGSDAAKDLRAEIAKLNAKLVDLLTTTYDAVPWMSDMGTAIGDTGDEAEEAAPKIHALARAYMHLSDETKEWVAARTDADIAGMDPYETLAGRLYAEEALETQKTKNAEREEQRAEDAARAWEKSYRDQQRAAEDAYRKITSAIESALTPTSVTAWDMAQTGMGTYVDKWDENARRLDAITQGGFAELEKHADWAAVLGIPPEVLAAGEDALKGWAEQTSRDVRSLFRPDLINIEAAVKTVEDYLKQQEARETTISLVASAMGMSAQDVGEALGDPMAIGRGTGEDVMEGFKAAMADTSPATSFLNYLREDADTSKAALFTAGEGLWLYVEDGLHTAISEGAYIEWLIDALLPGIRKWLRSNSQYYG